MERAFVDHKRFPEDSVLLAWQSTGVPDYDREMIIPKGCVEIIFNFSGDIITYGVEEREKSALPRCFVSGINTYPVILDHSSHHAFFGLRLHPHIVRPLLSAPSGAFIDQTVDLALLDPIFNQLWHQLYAIPFGQRIALIGNWVRRVYRTPRELDKAIGGFFGGPMDDLSVARLSERFCSSRRNLTRKFNELLGLCTEEALLYKKYLHSLELVHYTDLSFTKITYESNFYDQSHFTREFKRYAGLTPKDYRKCRGPVCGHIYRQRGTGFRHKG
ncbi:MAG TPA: AraC family transcriptional regulator [Puia sp.]|nr:AraC family transcriptional regulator [Puia sp.]